MSTHARCCNNVLGLWFKLISYLPCGVADSLFQYSMIIYEVSAFSSENREVHAQGIGKLDPESARCPLHGRACQLACQHRIYAIHDLSSKMGWAAQPAQAQNSKIIQPLSAQWEKSKTATASGASLSLHLAQMANPARPPSPARCAARPALDAARTIPQTMCS